MAKGTDGDPKPGNVLEWLFGAKGEETYGH